MKKTVLALLILVIFVLTTGIAFAAPPPVIKTDAPLPSEVNIEAPAADVAPELAAFSGTWFGLWKWDFYPDNVHMQRDSVIIVEKIEGNNVHMIFSYGVPRPPYNNRNGVWTRVVGTYDPVTNKVTVPLKPPMTMENQDATLWITPDGNMTGYRKQYIYDGNKASDYKAVYKKQQ